MLLDGRHSHGCCRRLGLTFLLSLRRQVLCVSSPNCTACAAPDVLFHAVALQSMHRCPYHLRLSAENPCGCIPCINSSQTVDCHVEACGSPLLMLVRVLGTRRLPFTDVQLRSSDNQRGCRAGIHVALVVHYCTDKRRPYKACRCCISQIICKASGTCWTSRQRSSSSELTWCQAWRPWGR